MQVWCECKLSCLLQALVQLDKLLLLKAPAAADSLSLDGMPELRRGCTAIQRNRILSD